MLSNGEPEIELEGPGEEVTTKTGGRVGESWLSGGIEAPIFGCRSGSEQQFGFSVSVLSISSPVLVTEGIFRVELLAVASFAFSITVCWSKEKSVDSSSDCDAFKLLPAGFFSKLLSNCCISISSEDESLSDAEQEEKQDRPSSSAELPMPEEEEGSGEMLLNF